MENKNIETIIKDGRTTINTDTFAVEVKEDNDRLGIIIDVFHKDGDLIDTYTYWNEDTYSDERKEALEEYRQLRKDDPNFANQWNNSEEDFLEWYEDVYLETEEN